MLECARQRREEPAPSTPGYYRDSITERCRKLTLGEPLGKEDRAPSPKRLVWMLLSDSETLDTAERVALDEMLKASTEVAVIHPLIQCFEKMIKQSSDNGQAAKLDR